MEKFGEIVSKNDLYKEERLGDLLTLVILGLSGVTGEIDKSKIFEEVVQVLYSQLSKLRLDSSEEVCDYVLSICLEWSEL